MLMIHAYDDFFLPIVQEHIANIFEVAVKYKNYSIDEIGNILVNSMYCKHLEDGNFQYVLGKSPVELLALILNEEPKEICQSEEASVEYWCGYVLAYAGWYLNRKYKEIIESYPLSSLMLDYFPFHEMDIAHIVEKISKKLGITNKLKQLRISNQLSQRELSLLSNVPIRTIRAYEQETVDLSKASGETLYSLAKVLKCSIEELIL